MAELSKISYPRKEKAAIALSTNVKRIVGDLDKESFISPISKLIGESKYLQNNPPKLIHQEHLAVKHVFDSLLHHNTTIGPNTKILSFVGCHTDVVTANPND
ncbi:hypothetical protein ACFXTH_015267 [Malus domestica]